MLARSHYGFTLIEVLIAVVVLALGLLGLAATQATALRNNQGSYYRSLATELAYDIADRMRVNKVEAAKGVNSKYITVLPTAAAEKTACDSSPGCSGTVMAEHDLYHWNSQIQQGLPKGEGLINFVNPNIMSVTIKWDDNRDNAVNEDDPSFQVRFQI